MRLQQLLADAAQLGHVAYRRRQLRAGNRAPSAEMRPHRCCPLSLIVFLFFCFFACSAAGPRKDFVARADSVTDGPRNAQAARPVPDHATLPDHLNDLAASTRGDLP